MNEGNVIFEEISNTVRQLAAERNILATELARRGCPYVVLLVSQYPDCPIKACKGITCDASNIHAVCACWINWARQECGGAK